MSRRATSAHAGPSSCSAGSTGAGGQALHLAGDRQRLIGVTHDGVGDGEQRQLQAVRAVGAAARRQLGRFGQPPARRPRPPGEQGRAAESEGEPIATERRTVGDALVPAGGEALGLGQPPHLQKPLDAVHDVDAGMGDRRLLAELAVLTVGDRGLGERRLAQPGRQQGRDAGDRPQHLRPR